MNGKDRVEQMRQTDTDAPLKPGGTSVRRRQSSTGDHAPRLEARLVVAKDQFIGDTAGRRLVGQFQGLGAKPLYADYRDNLVGQNPSNCGGLLKVFKTAHVLGGMHAR